MGRGRRRSQEESALRCVMMGYSGVDLRATRSVDEMWGLREAVFVALGMMARLRARRDARRTW